MVGLISGLDMSSDIFFEGGGGILGPGAPPWYATSHKLVKLFITNFDMKNQKKNKRLMKHKKQAFRTP